MKMVKKFSYIPIFLFILGCSGFEFIYDKSPILEALTSNTVFSVEGDDTQIIKSYLRERLGYSKDNNSYIIKTGSKKIETNLVIEKDATASKININHKIDYTLIMAEDNCIILEKNFSTKSTYDSKSSGYNFGTDISKADISQQNIENNIEKFLTFISTNIDILECSNED